MSFNQLLVEANFLVQIVKPNCRQQQGALLHRGDASVKASTCCHPLT